MSERSHIHTNDIIVDADEHFTIDTVTRAISSNNNKKLSIMQYDNNSERYSFDIDRVIDGHDLIDSNRVQIHFINIGSNKLKHPGLYLVDDVMAKPSEEDKITFSWLISNDATQYDGILAFLVSFECVNDGKVLYRWSSSIFKQIQITAGMDNDGCIMETYADELLAWQNSMETEFLPELVDKLYVEREFATSEEVATVFGITNPDAVAQVAVVEFDELKAYINGSITTAVSNEATLRENADTTLQTNINNKVDKVDGKDLSTNDYDNTEKSNVAGNTSARHTHSNKELLDSYDQMNVNIKDAVDKKHSHSNKELLDTYTQTETNLADAVSKKHNHSNKSLLDTYTQTETNLADAVSKKHSHSNKSVLDNTTASYTTEEKTKLSGIASGAEVNVQSDWNVTDTTSDAYIKNKPNIPDGAVLYSAIGQNTNGAMTQKATTDALNTEVSGLQSQIDSLQTLIDGLQTQINNMLNGTTTFAYLKANTVDLV